MRRIKYRADNVIWAGGVCIKEEIRNYRQATRVFYDIQNAIVVIIDILFIMNIVAIGIECFTEVTVNVQHNRVAAVIGQIAICVSQCN